MKKLLTVLLSLSLLTCLVACGNKQEEEKKTIKVGVVQLVEHPALDQATQGFVDVLQAEFGDGVKIDVRNASNSPENCITIASGFVSDGVDLIMANATPAFQAAASATGDIPVVGTSVTEYGTALDIADFSGTIGNNLTGVSDLAPIDQQAKMISELFPEAKNVGVLYCVSEANSLYQVKAITQELGKLGLSVAAYGFNDSNDITSVCETACQNSDVIYIPTDNSAASNTEAIANVVLSDEYLTPVFAAEEGIASGCGIATLTISYYDLGTKTGKVAIDILKGSDVSQMPIQYSDTFTKKYNPAIAEKFNMTFSSDYQAIEG